MAYFPLLRKFFNRYFPEWSLPQQFILKQQKDNWEEEFEAEKSMYYRLRPIQGQVIPEYYGEVTCEGRRALLLSDIGGVNLATAEGALREVGVISRLLTEAMNTLGEFGITHDDIKLDNFHLVEDKVMMVDLETMNEGLGEDAVKFSIKASVAMLTRLYKGNQMCFWEDGEIDAEE